MRRSGKYAYVDGIGCTTGWQANKNANVGRYAASCSPDGSATVAGNVDWTGQMAGIGYLPPMPNEDDYDFVGVASAKEGEISNYEGSVLVTQTTLNIPVATNGGVIGWTADFGVQGDLAHENATQYLDDVRAPGAPAKFGRISVEDVLDSDTFVDIDDVQNITLVFRRPPVTSVNDGLTYRESGNLEVDINFTVHNDDMENPLFELNNYNRVRVYVTDTLFYLFDSIQWSQQGPFNVRRNPPAMIDFTVNGLWTALRPRTPAALGMILLPGGGQFYGEEES